VTVTAAATEVTVSANSFDNSLRLATVSADELPKPAAGAVIVVNDPATGTVTLAISDGTAWHPMSLGAAIK
jgi:hypothetical protein